jgi:hypothetical protein
MERIELALMTAAADERPVGDAPFRLERPDGRGICTWTAT